MHLNNLNAPVLNVLIYSQQPTPCLKPYPNLSSPQPSTPFFITCEALCNILWYFDFLFLQRWIFSFSLNLQVKDSPFCGCLWRLIHAVVARMYI